MNVDVVIPVVIGLVAFVGTLAIFFSMGRRFERDVQKLGPFAERSSTFRRWDWLCPRCGKTADHIMSDGSGIICLGNDCGYAPFPENWFKGRTDPAVRVCSTCDTRI